MNYIFWVSLLLIFYTYVGYPVLVYLFSLFLKRDIRKEKFCPTVSILMSVYNEQNNIEQKIKNLMQLDYPKEKLEILIGSDGSTDNSETIISKYANNGIKLYKQDTRKGKPSMLNILAAQSQGQILVFTDARQRLRKDCLKMLVRNFSDDSVGSVSGQLIFESENTKVGNGVGLYWRYEKFIRNCESKIGSMLGATGALYAIRQELFPELPKDLILDDVYYEDKGKQ